MERILLLLLVGLLSYLVYLIFSPFLVPLVWGVVLTIMFFPVHRRLRRRIPQANLAALVSTLLVTVIIIAPTLTVAGVFTAQAVGIAQEVQSDWQAGRMPFGRYLQGIPFERILDYLAQYNISEDDIRGAITKNTESIATFVARQTGRMAKNVFLFFFDVFVMLFVAFYLFRDGPDLVELMRQALPLDIAYREGLFYIAQNVLEASVFSGIVVASVQGALGGVVFWILGIHAPVVWGVIMAFFALLPIIGPWLIWVPAVIVFFTSGSYIKGIVLLLLGAVVISGVDNVLRPLLISGRAQMNGLLVFISILGGVSAFGMVGVVLGPILVALADAVLQTYASAQARARLTSETN